MTAKIDVIVEQIKEYKHFVKVTDQVLEKEDFKNPHYTIELFMKKMKADAKAHEILETINKKDIKDILNKLSTNEKTLLKELAINRDNFLIETIKEVEEC